MEKYDLTEQEKRNWSIAAGVVCFIIVGLILIGTQPVQAIEQFNASQPGERNPGDLFQFTMQNVSGTYESVTHHWTVTTSLLFEKEVPYHYWSIKYGQWFNTSPENGKRWLFVWVGDYTEGGTTWPYDIDQFTIWIWGNTTIKAEPVQLEDLSSWDDKHRGPAIIEGVTYRHIAPGDFNYYGDPYGWRDGYFVPRLEPGKSNALTGFIAFQIPAAARLQDLQVSGWFMNFGGARWNLIARNITQETIAPEIPLVISPTKAIERRNENPNVITTVTPDQKNGRHRA